MQKGGTDKYANLVFLADRVHVLLHATREKTLNTLLAELNLDKKQLAKLNKFLRLAEIPEII
ncbi:hypothetical protein OBV_08310 [Oscillibacter valericigenes Sjm18-20]|nr:hypothetical protein OBV_08310 [Oscillibacter valericigenes Sjm18-20]